MPRSKDGHKLSFLAWAWVYELGNPQTSSWIKPQAGTPSQAKLVQGWHALTIFEWCWVPLWHAQINQQWCEQLVLHLHCFWLTWAHQGWCSKPPGSGEGMQVPKPQPNWAKRLICEPPVQVPKLPKVCPKLWLSFESMPIPQWAFPVFICLTIARTSFRDTGGQSGIRVMSVLKEAVEPLSVSLNWELTGEGRIQAELNQSISLQNSIPRWTMGYQMLNCHLTEKT